MSIAAALGAMGTLIGIVRALPQLLRLLRTRQAHGVSVDTAATSSAVSFGWATYGVLTVQPFVSLATGSSGIIFALITLAALRFGRHFREFRVAPVWMVILLLSGVIARQEGLGIVLPVSVLAANLPQVWTAYKETNLSELSLGTWLFSMSDGLVWGTYSLIEHDVAIMVFGGLQLTTSSAIVALKLWRRARQPKRSSVS